MHALTEELAIRRVEYRSEKRASGGGNGTSTSSATMLFCFAAGTFIPHATSSPRAGSDPYRHPTAPFAWSSDCTSSTYRGGGRGLTNGKGRSGTVMGTGRERGRKREKEQKTGTGPRTGAGTAAETVTEKIMDRGESTTSGLEQSRRSGPGTPHTLSSL